jgi:hypothetical protein
LTDKAFSERLPAINLAYIDQNNLLERGRLTRQILDQLPVTPLVTPDWLCSANRRPLLWSLRIGFVLPTGRSFGDFVLASFCHLAVAHSGHTDLASFCRAAALCSNGSPSS